MSPFPLLDELPDAEQQAMRLDGECYRLGEVHLPIGVVPDSSARCIAALGAHSPRLIAALGTAAWIWGAADGPPARGEFLVDLEARWRPPFSSRLRIIESVVHPSDVTRFGHAAVTTPLRTVLDLARFTEAFGEAETDAARRLARIAGFGVAEALAAMERTRNLAGKHRAAQRLRAVFSRS